jgi:signal transduction histidine kinase
LNLLVNAAHAVGDVHKATGERGKITISTRVDGAAVVIAITDTGPGIPPEIQSRIFEPFFTTKEVGRGTGQGLSIARNIVVKRHQGTVWFETRPGDGTTFFVRLPAQAVASSQEAA